MNNTELRDVLNTIAKKYPEFIEGGNVAEIKKTWEEEIGGEKFSDIMPKLRNYIASNPFPPKPSDLFEEDHTFRNLAKLYAEICKLEVPKFKTDMEAYEWMGDQEKQRP